MGEEAFLAFGWRIPFLLSIVLVGVGLYVRLRIEETPVFRAAMARPQPRRAPVVEVFRRQGREILLAGGSLTALFGLFYIGTVYLTSYGTAVLGQSRTTMLLLGVLASVVFAVFTAASAILSDRVGRRPLLLAGNIAATVWALLLFPVVDTGDPVLVGIGLAVTLAVVAVCYGPAGAYLPELFETRYRYTGAGVGYALAGILGGAVPPLLAASLQSSYGSFAIGAFLAALGVVSVLCTLALRPTAVAGSLAEPAPVTA